MRPIAPAQARSRRAGQAVGSGQRERLKSSSAVTPARWSASGSLCSGARLGWRPGDHRAQAIDRALGVRPELDLDAHRLRAPTHGAGGGGRGAVIGDVVTAERAADERARAAGQVGGGSERRVAAVRREPQ